MTEFTKNQILVQSAVAMLAQANSLPQLALNSSAVKIHSCRGGEAISSPLRPPFGLSYE